MCIKYTGLNIISQIPHYTWLMDRAALMLHLICVKKDQKNFFTTLKNFFFVHFIFQQFFFYFWVPIYILCVNNKIKATKKLYKKLWQSTKLTYHILNNNKKSILQKLIINTYLCIQICSFPYKIKFYYE